MFMKWSKVHRMHRSGLSLWKLQIGVCDVMATVTLLHIIVCIIKDLECSRNHLQGPVLANIHEMSKEGELVWAESITLDENFGTFTTTDIEFKVNIPDFFIYSSSLLPNAIVVFVSIVKEQCSHSQSFLHPWLPRHLLDYTLCLLHRDQELWIQHSSSAWSQWRFRLCLQDWYEYSDGNFLVQEIMGEQTQA